MNLLTIEQLRDRKYSAPPLKIEKIFFERQEYIAYLASYISDGLKIYGFLTVPKDQKKEYSVIIFNKGYLPLDTYATDRQYLRYIDYLAKAGFVVFKSDYRGHGSSEGKAETIFEAGYAIDVLNAIEALKHGISINNELLTMNDLLLWGHSLGGDITLKVLEVNSNIKAASIWSAPTVSYDRLVKRWLENPERKALAEQLISKLGDPDNNQSEYAKYSPVKNLQYISEVCELTLLNTPIQIIHGKQDDRVPVSDSENLAVELKKLSKGVELKMIKGNHNLTDNLDKAMKETINFFRKS